jgi:integrase
VRLGPQNINNGRLRYTMAKNEHRNPIDVEIPVLPELAKALASAKRVGIKHFLVKSTGKPYSVRGFASVFERWCKQAGVKKSSHGFRKTIGATLADNGATPHEIMSWLGHRTLTEAQRYSLTANRSKLADSAASKMK